MRRLVSFAGLAGVLVGLVGMAMTLFGGRVSEVALWHFTAAGVMVGIYAVSRISSFVKVLRSRQARLGALVSFYTAIVVALIVVVNVIGALSNMQLADLTERGLYTLSSQTRMVLASLGDDLYIYAFFRGGRDGLTSMRDVDRLLRTFDATSQKVHLEVVDPELDPHKAEKYGVFQDATVIVEYGKQTQKVNTITEQTLVNALIRVVDERPKTVCFTTGHGEPPIAGSAANRFDGMGKFKTLLEEKDYSAITVDIASELSIPPECTLVAMAGPSTPVATGELTLLDNYLRSGGRVFIAQDAGLNSNLNNLLEIWGVKLSDRIVLEKLVEGTLSDGQGFLPTRMKVSMLLTVTHYNRRQPITQDLSIIHPTQFQKARDIEVVPASEKIRVNKLFYSKEDSWGETRVDEALTMGRAILNPRDGDVTGPLPLATAVSLTTQPTTEALSGYSRQARLVVVGNASWLQNLLLDETRNFNPDLALNIIGWLAGMEEYLAIGSKASAARSLFLRRQQKQRLFNTTVIFLPEFFLILGLLVWWMRR